MILNLLHIKYQPLIPDSWHYLPFYVSDPDMPIPSQSLEAFSCTSTYVCTYMLSDFFHYSLRIQIQYSQPNAESGGGGGEWHVSFQHI